MGLFFDSRFEQESIDAGISQRQQEVGVTVDWFFFNKQRSRPDPLYGEGGRAYDGPYPMPVFQVTRIEGGLNDTGEGLYPVDSLDMSISYAQAMESGLLPVVDETHDHLRDRFIFEGEVWSPNQIISRNLLGGRNNRRSMIHIRASQVMPDEMVQDPDFQQWAAPPTSSPDPGYDVS